MHRLRSAASYINSIVPSIEPTEEQIAESLSILGMDQSGFGCSYCGDPATEWDHFRPLVKDKKPTGYISEIHNLVPACGKCNQSKGNKDWKTWMLSDANLSPKSRDIADIDDRIRRLEAYAEWRSAAQIDFDEERVACAADRNYNRCLSRLRQVLAGLCCRWIGCRNVVNPAIWARHPCPDAYLQMNARFMKPAVTVA